MRIAAQTAESEIRELNAAKLRMDEELHANTTALDHMVNSEPVHQQKNTGKLDPLRKLVADIEKETIEFRGTLDTEQLQMLSEAADLEDQLRQQRLQGRAARQEAELLREHLAEVHATHADIQSRNSELQVETRKLASRASSMSTELSATRNKLVQPHQSSTPKLPASNLTATSGDPPPPRMIRLNR